MRALWYEFSGDYLDLQLKNKLCHNVDNVCKLEDSDSQEEQSSIRNLYFRAAFGQTRKLFQNLR